MESFFNPKTVALVGASSKKERARNQIFNNLFDCFKDNFYPVNPNTKKIDDKKCYASILNIPVQIDLVILFITASLVPDVLKQCAQKNIKNIIIESGGFAETGEKGINIHQSCLEIAKKNNLRLWGPNCMGAINVHEMKIMSFFRMDLWKGVLFPGPVSLIVQSGMLSATFLTEVIGKKPFGLSKICSIGNKMDMDESDVLEYLVNDPQTKVIAIYLESIKNGRRFYSVLKNTDKPVVILKSGSTEKGAGAAMSHTASLAQNHLVEESALKQAGAIVIKDDMYELMDVTRSLSISQSISPKKGKKVAIVTISGASGVVTIDSMNDYGMEVADIEEKTVSQLQKVYPDWMTPKNPLDIYPTIEKNGYSEVIHHCFEATIKDPNVDGIYLQLYIPSTGKDLFDYEKIESLLKKYKKPVIFWALGEDASSVKVSQQFENIGISVTSEINRGVRMMAAVLSGR